MPSGCKFPGSLGFHQGAVFQPRWVPLRSLFFKNRNLAFTTQ